VSRAPQAGLSAVLAISLLMAACGGTTDSSPNPQPNPLPTPVPYRVEIFLSGLQFPVKLAFAPDGRLFYSELASGRIRVVENGTLRAQAFATLTVNTSGERGLLGLAFDPQFSANRFVYAYYSDPSGDNRVVRFTDSNSTGTNLTAVVSGLPSANIHNAGDIGFGPQGHLFVSLGDVADPANSQDPNARAGKILRYHANGTVPAGNPFGAGNPAFAMGLRNSFDFAFHPTAGTMYASENGPNCDDELNRIVSGGNYGWRPSYPCGDTSTTFIAPLQRFNPSIAPTGVVFYTSNVLPQFTGDLFMVDFNTGRVRRFRVNESQNGQVTQTEVVVDGGFGSLLDIVQGPDGFLYFSSTDAILRIRPQ